MNNKIRKDFPWLKNHNNMIYFDSAATSLKPQCVIDAINDFYINYGTNTHNADSNFAFQTTLKIKSIRRKTAKLFNAKEQNIVFTSGTTEGINLVAYGLSNFLQKDDEVLVSKLEHASNLLPWIMLANKNKIKLKYLPNNSIPQTQDFLKAVSAKTKVVTFSASSNIMGNLIDYKKLVRNIKKINKNIIVVMDAAQFLPHHKVDCSCGIDFVCSSAHKLLGPTGLGVTYMSDKWIKILPPLKYGGGMNEVINLFDFTYVTGPEKFEGGTPPLAQIFGFGAAIDYLNKISFKKIDSYLQNLKKYFIKKLSIVKNIIIYSKNQPEPIIFFNIKNVHAQDLANWLGTKNVICRAGLSCAKLARYILHIEAAVRLSLYFYNTKEEIDKFIEILCHFKKGDEIIL